MATSVYTQTIFHQLLSLVPAMYVTKIAQMVLYVMGRMRISRAVVCKHVQKENPCTGDLCTVNTLSALVLSPDPGVHEKFGVCMGTRL